MSEIVNNRDFYRKITFILDAPKFEECRNGLTAQREKLERAIKKMRTELDDVEAQLRRVDNDLTYHETLTFDDVDMQLINTNLLSMEEAKRVQKHISGDSMALKIWTKVGYVDLYNKRVPVPAGLGSYYLIGKKWNFTMQSIYCRGGNVARYHGEWIHKTSGRCDFCNENKSLTILFFYAPGIQREYPNATKLNNDIAVRTCASCYTDEHRTLQYDIYVQNAYNKSMHFSKALRLLLCTRAREKGNVFHEDNLPRDVFKIILRLVFPEAFLMIK